MEGEESKKNIIMIALHLTVKQPVSILVWSCMKWNFESIICMINDNINVQNCINEIPEPKLKPLTCDRFEEIEDCEKCERKLWRNCKVFTLTGLK